MPNQDDDRLLSLKEGASRLGVSENTMRRWVSRQDIKAKKIGGLWRIRPQDLQQKWKD